MKETEQKNEIVIESVKRNEIEKQLKLIGQIILKPNHILFEIDLNKGEINRAEFEVNDLHYLKAKEGNFNTNKKVIVKKGCFYISALNLKNCKKILKNNFGVVFKD